MSSQDYKSIKAVCYIQEPTIILNFYTEVYIRLKKLLYIDQNYISVLDVLNHLVPLLKPFLESLGYCNDQNAL